MSLPTRGKRTAVKPGPEPFVRAGRASLQIPGPAHYATPP
jgi:hypothetical protein